MTSVRIGQILAGILALVLAGFGMFYLINPEAAAAARGVVPQGDYGMTNVRIMGAPLLAFALMAAIGAKTKNFVFVAPAALYFLFVIIIRIVGIFADGAHPDTTKGLILAGVLFVVAEVALQLFKRAK